MATKSRIANTQHFHGAKIYADGYVSLTNVGGNGSIVAGVNDTNGFITAGTTKVEGGTLSHTGVGEYTLALESSYPRVSHCLAMMQFDDTTGNYFVSACVKNVAKTVGLGSQTVRFFITNGSGTKVDATVPVGFSYQLVLHGRA